MSRQNHWWQFHFTHWNMDIIEYYIFKCLQQIGNSLTNLFVPIYLYSDLGYQLWQVFFFYVMLQVAWPASVIFSGNIIKKLGLKLPMILSLPITAGYFFSLQFLTGDFLSDLWIFIPVLFVRAFFRANGAVADEIFMAKHVLKNKPGKMLAWLRIVLTIGTLISPLIGGIVSYHFGFDALFYLGVAITLAAGIPLIMTHKSHFEVQYKPTDLVYFLRKKARRNYLIAEFGNVFTDTVMWILWPLFLFFALGSTADLGTLVTASAVISIIVTYFVGKKINDFDPKKMIKNGVKTLSVLFCARALFLNPIVIGVLDALNKIVDPVMRIPYDRASYKLVNNHVDPIKRATIKKLVSEIYYTIGTIILLLIGLFVDESSKYFFIGFFAFSAVVMLLMQRMAHVKFSKADEKAIKADTKEGLVEEGVEILKQGEFGQY